MGNESYHSGAHCKYLVQYHIIWCPKYRYWVLNGEKTERLKGILADICMEYHYTVKALEVMPDHIHLFVDAPHTVAPCDIVRTLKSRSAVRLLAECPDLRKFYSRCGVLWSRGYFISSVGQISGDTVKRYIEEQKQHERK